MRVWMMFMMNIGVRMGLFDVSFGVVDLTIKQFLKDVIKQSRDSWKGQFYFGGIYCFVCFAYNCDGKYI